MSWQFRIVVTVVVIGLSVIVIHLAQIGRANKARAAAPAAATTEIAPILLSCEAAVMKSGNVGVVITARGAQ